MKMLILIMSITMMSSGILLADEHGKKQEMQSRQGTQGVGTNQNRPTQLDDLIRGEMAAVKSYDQVLGKVKDENEKRRLQTMRDHHQQAVTTLKQYANKEVREDTQTAGPWGTFTKSYTGAASVFGDKTAIRALKQGEEHGIREYEEALGDENLNPELKQKIRAELLPRQKKHVETLNNYL